MAWTRQLSCGFEAVDYSECDWSDSDKGTGDITTTAKTGTYAYRIGGSAGTYSAGAGKTFSSAVSARAGAWYLYNSAQAGIYTWLFRVRNTAGDVTGVRYTVTGDDLELVVKGTVQASDTLAGGGLNDNANWHHIALFFKADESSGVISFYVDGVQVFTYSGNTGADITELYCCSGNATAAGLYNGRIDDLYIDSSSSAETDGAPPPLVFIPCYPDGAGSATDWTPNTGDNYAAVDETGAHDSDTTYVSTSTNGHVDLYTVGNPTVPAGYAVVAAVATAIAKNSESGPGLQLRVKTGANTADSATLTLGTSYACKSNRWVKQADGTTDWDATAFNSAEFGYESIIA